MKNYYSLSVSRTVNQLIMRVHKPKVEYKLVHLYSYTQGSTLTYYYINNTPKVASVGCVGLWKHNGVLSRLMEQNKTKHSLALSRVEPRVTKFDKVPIPFNPR